MPTFTQCPACGEPVQPFWRDCPQCGVAFTPGAPGVAPLPTPAIGLVNCPACGGALPLPAAGAQYIRCSYCRSSLHLRRDGDTLLLELAYRPGPPVSRDGPLPEGPCGLQPAAQLQQLLLELPALRARVAALQRGGGGLELVEAKRRLAAVEDQTWALQLELYPEGFQQAHPPHPSLMPRLLGVAALAALLAGIALIILH
jgi:LSD1 subclass zinc finger protein